MKNQCQLSTFVSTEFLIEELIAYTFELSWSECLIWLTLPLKVYSVLYVWSECLFWLSLPLKVYSILYV